MSEPAAPVAPEPVVAAVDPAAPPVPPEKPAEPKVEPAAARFAAIAKKERELVQKQQAAKAELEAERAKLAEERKQLEQGRQQVSAFERAKAQAKLDPDGFLRPLLGEGWYDFLTEYRLSGGKASPEEIARVVREQVEGDLNSRMSKVEEERKRAEEERAAKEREAQAQREAEVLEQFKQNLFEFGRQNADKYELVHMEDEHQTVFDVIKAHHEKTGKVLSNDEAYGLVEKHLEEKAARLRAAKKFQAAPAAPAADQRAPSESPTLSNSLSPTPTSAGEPKTEAERIQRAMAAMDAAAAKIRAAT